MDEWLKIIGALGGLEAIRFTVTFLANRKTNARKEKAYEMYRNYGFTEKSINMELK